MTFRPVTVLRLVACLITTACMLIALCIVTGFVTRTAYLTVQYFIRDCPSDDYLFTGPVFQNDSCLIQLIRDKHLIPPCDYNEPYNLTKEPRTFHPILPVIMQYFPDKLKHKGFFFDCGAHDGEYNSNTLILEMELGWTGILIEATEETFQILTEKRRKAWLANLCLATTQFTRKQPFWKSERSFLNGLDDRDGQVGPMTPAKLVNCVPFYTIISALNMSVVNFFSLDIEGKELEVLQTIPFDVVTIHVIQVEHWWVSGGQAAIKSFLEPKGFQFIRSIEGVSTRDSVFVHKSLTDQ